MPEDYGHLAEELRAGRPVATPTRGSSMEPLLYEGKTVAVVMPLSGPLRRGDVALYRRDSGLFVLHRVVSVRGGGYLLRGDNCFYQEQVRPGQMLGVLAEVVRNGKTLRVTDGRYRCYTAFWLASYPVRAFFHRFPLKKWPYYFAHLPTLLHKKFTQHRNHS